MIGSVCQLVGFRVAESVQQAETESWRHVGFN